MASLQVTLLREHCQGPNAMLYTLPTGGYDPRKSESFLAAAQAELSEEVSLCVIVFIVYNVTSMALVRKPCQGPNAVP